MSFEILSIFVDVVVVGFLAATLLYAYRLSRSLDNFRRYRRDFEKLMADLSIQIERAQNAIAGMKEAGGRSGQDLQDQIDEARLMIDELRMVNDASKNMADRMEGLAGATRRARQTGHIASSMPSPGKSGRDENPSFVIRDRDIGTDTESGAAGSFESKAEQELYEALQHRHRSG